MVELGLVSLVGKAISGGVFSGQLYAQEDLCNLYVDRCSCIPVLLVGWPEASQHWSLQAVGEGSVLVREWWTPGGLIP